MHLPSPLAAHSRHVHFCPWLWAWPLWPAWPMSSEAKPGEGCAQVEIWRRIQRFLHSFASTLCQRNGMSYRKASFCPGCGTDAARESARPWDFGVLLLQPWGHQSGQHRQRPEEGFSASEAKSSQAGSHHPRLAPSSGPMTALSMGLASNKHQWPRNSMSISLTLPQPRIRF